MTSLLYFMKCDGVGLPSQHCDLGPVVMSPDESECDPVSEQDLVVARELWRSGSWAKEMKI
jgi:hypothetical protein